MQIDRFYALGRRLCKLAGEYPIGYGTAMCRLHEWNSSREWKDDGWQHYELDLRTWVFLLIHIEFATAGITGIQNERIIHKYNVYHSLQMHYRCYPESLVGCDE